MVHELEIPLFFKLHDAPGNEGYPEVFPFRLIEVDGVPRQASTPELKDMIRRIYSQGLMMVGSMDGDDLAGSLHAADCLAFMQESLGDLRERQILEVGCGRGVMLKQLANFGAHCVGLEPGSQIVDASHVRVRLINDFFPSPQLAGASFDAVISFNVIEHIEDLPAFFEAFYQVLVADGELVFCVPNCGPYIAAGDISILLHEHFNYFTA